MADITSCLHIPAGSRYLLVYAWMIDACDGNECAAALLAYFAGWHDTKLKQAIKARQANDIAEAHGMQRRRYDESLVQFHTDQEIEEGILFYKRRSFAAAFALLNKKGFLSIFKNPNPRAHFDRTRHFLFHPETVNRWLAQYVRTRKNADQERFGKSAESNGEKVSTLGKNAEYPITDSNTDIASAISTDIEKGKKRKPRKSPDEPLPAEFREINADIIKTAEDVIADAKHNPRSLRINIAREHSKFVNHADQNERLCKGERGWRAAWRNWIIGAIERAEKGATSQGAAEVAQTDAEEDAEFTRLADEVERQRAARKQEGARK